MKTTTEEKSTESPETPAASGFARSIDILCWCCEHELAFRWTDTHGVGVCCHCGLPYRIIHYDENNDRVDKAPEVCIKEFWLPICKKYFSETGRMVAPAAFDTGFTGFMGRSCSGAAIRDVDDWNEWMKEHKSELPEI